MIQLYEPAAYCRPEACLWSDTVDAQRWPQLTGDARAEVAIIGGGVTGLSAALHLAEAGHDTCLLDAEMPGFGASGRNGGFVCLGGAKASRQTLIRRHGVESWRAWCATERAAIDRVAELIDRHGLEVARHSDGETLLAHTRRAWRRMVAERPLIEADHGVSAALVPREALAEAGFGGPWHGAMTIPLGFAIDPGRFLTGLARAATSVGVRICAQSPVTRLAKSDDWRISTPHGTLTARKVILATNGYGAEDLPPWLAGRTLPVLSNVIVTRPLSDAELTAQGWHSTQMSYDTRRLLHYFRLMPDRRFLFGMRGGLSARPGAEARTATRIRADFARLFPAWQDVPITHHWSGLVCLTARLTPFAGPVPGHDGLYAGFGYHGNGLAMGTHVGWLLAEQLRGRVLALPDLLTHAPGRFPLGRYRRALLAPAYLAAAMLDL